MCICPVINQAIQVLGLSWRDYPRLEAGLELALGAVAVALRSLLTNDLQKVGLRVEGVPAGLG